MVGTYRNKDRVVILEQKTAAGVLWGKTDKGWISLEYVTLDAPEPPATEPPAPTEPEPITGTVKVNISLRVRKGPGTSYAVCDYYYNGNRVTITETKTVGSSVWGKTEKGWISLNYVVVDKTPEDNSFMVTITASVRLNVRSGPGTANKIVGGLDRGVKVRIYETKMVGSTKWGRTDLGWISMNYTK